MRLEDTMQIALWHVKAVLYQVVIRPEAVSVNPERPFAVLDFTRHLAGYCCHQL